MNQYIAWRTVSQYIESCCDIYHIQILANAQPLYGTVCLEWMGYSLCMSEEAAWPHLLM